MSSFTRWARYARLCPNPIRRAGKGWLIAILLAFLPVARGQEAAKSGGGQWFKRLDASQFADLDEQIQKVYAKIAPAVVRIVPDEHNLKNGFSGVIVSRSGEVFTCAHHDLAPRTTVTVVLADGSRVKGTMLGLAKKPGRSAYDRAHDIGMMRLDEKRDWPAAPLGRPDDLDNGEMCMAVGYPSFHEPGSPPLLRLGRVLPPREYGAVRCSCRIHGGDSGGPLFDLRGRVLGVARGMTSFEVAGSDYVAVDVFVEFRDRLRQGEEIVAERERPGRPIRPTRDAWGAFEPTADLAQTVGAARRSTVEILGDGKPAALGLIVEPDGWIVSKWTELAGCRRIACRLSDERLLEARIMCGSKGYDLALLKVGAVGLPVGTWARPGRPHVGQLVATLIPHPRPIQFGVVGGIRISNPGVKGFLPIDAKPAASEGLSPAAFVDIFPKDRPDVGNLRQKLKTGDLITSVDDVSTPTAKDFFELRDKRAAAPDALIGERIKLTIRRGNTSRQVFVPIVPTATPQVWLWKECPLSLRRNGFPNVFAHDGGIAPDQCGGPVAARSGEILGINIARANMVQTLVIPSDVVQKLVSELKGKAEKH